MSEGDTIPMRGSADMWRSRAKAAEAENQRLQAEVARLTQQLDDLGHRYAGVESSLHGANARIAELEAACVIPDSGGHLESADCWCGPTVEEHPGVTLIIHNQTH